MHKIPFDRQWFHFMFTWDESAGLKVFVNGVFVLLGVHLESVNAAGKTAPPLDEIIVGRPDRLEQLSNYGHFDIGHIVIWEYALTLKEVTAAYKTSIKLDLKHKSCCVKKSGS